MLHLWGHIADIAAIDRKWALAPLTQGLPALFTAELSQSQAKTGVQWFT